MKAVLFGTLLLMGIAAHLVAAQELSPPALADGMEPLGELSSLGSWHEPGEWHRQVRHAM